MSDFYDVVAKIGSTKELVDWFNSHSVVMRCIPLLGDAVADRLAELVVVESDA